jgi:hypothetical protein
MDVKLVLNWFADQKGRGRKNEITLETAVPMKWKCKGLPKKLSTNV